MKYFDISRKNNSLCDTKQNMMSNISPQTGEEKRAAAGSGYRQRPDASTSP